MPNFYLIGDSTVAKFNDVTYYYSRFGYGKKLDNYFKDINLPTQPDEPIPILDDTYAEITYAGKEPHVKVNGGYKAITIRYYSKTTEIVDQTPGNWEFYIDQVEVSDLIKVMETDTPNTIKIKFLGNEEFLGNVLTVKNTRNEIIGKLNLEITSL